MLLKVGFLRSNQYCRQRDDTLDGFTSICCCNPGAGACALWAILSWSWASLSEVALAEDTRYCQSRACSCWHGCAAGVHPLWQCICNRVSTATLHASCRQWKAWIIPSYFTYFLQSCIKAVATKYLTLFILCLSEFVVYQNENGLLPVYIHLHFSFGFFFFFFMQNSWLSRNKLHTVIWRNSCQFSSNKTLHGGLTLSAGNCLLLQAKKSKVLTTTYLTFCKTSTKPSPRFKLLLGKTWNFCKYVFARLPEK